MKIVAYYHEETDAHGVTRKSVGLENRETVMDEPLVLERDALAEIDDWRRGAKAEADAGDEARAECRQLRAELAALKAQEPVVMDVLRDVADSLRHFMGVFGQGRIKDGKALDAADSLLAAPVVSAEQQGVADGWKLVPAEPTQEMNNAFHAAISTWLEEIGHDDDVYKAMLAAAPAPSTTEGRGDDACKWTRDEETGSYETQCGKTWHLSDGGYPEEHGQYFCHHCGKKIDEEAEIHE